MPHIARCIWEQHEILRILGPCRQMGHDVRVRIFLKSLQDLELTLKISASPLRAVPILFEGEGDCSILHQLVSDCVRVDIGRLPLPVRDDLCLF